MESLIEVADVNRRSAIGESQPVQSDWCRKFASLQTLCRWYPFRGYRFAQPPVIESLRSPVLRTQHSRRYCTCSLKYRPRSRTQCCRSVMQCFCEVGIMSLFVRLDILFRLKSCLSIHRLCRLIEHSENSLILLQLLC